MSRLNELAEGVAEWLGFAERLGPAQRRVILGLSARENGARTDADQSETRGDFRVSFESRSPRGGPKIV